MTQAPAHRPLHGVNLRRIMARLNMTLVDVVAATGVDERTIRSVLRGAGRPQAKTLHKLARGLGVDSDELFADAGGRQAAFDRHSNPAVAEAIDSHPQLFANWTAADFDELFSRVAVGGELTEEGAVAAAEEMNRRRQVLTQAALVLETAEADLLREFIAMLYRRVTVAPQVLSADGADGRRLTKAGGQTC
jgi:transcriptional regulator with XRE-family HTH domain